MPFVPRRIALTIVAAACAIAPAAHAASGGIDSFWASATQVKVGDTVDFEATLSLATTSSAYGGSDPNEPPPVEGYQEWNVNWYFWEHESLQNVWLQAGSEGFLDSPSMGPGESYGRTWSFSVKFDQPGSFDFTLAGGWQSRIDTGYSSESASRNCYHVDPDSGGELFCDSWSWNYSDYSDWYTTDGSLSGPTIHVDVLAVPEPGTWALALAGVGLLAARTRVGRG